MGTSHGYKQGWDIQQKTIQAMVDKQNAQTTAQNLAITGLEQQASDAADKAREASNLASQARSTVITKYKTQYQTIASSCGWDVPTVQAINAIINSDPDNAAANALAPSTPASSTGIIPTPSLPLPSAPATTQTK